MINFPQTKITRAIEAEVTKKLKDYIPKNEEVGIKKVTEYVKSARDNRCKDLPEQFKEVTVASHGEDEHWLGFSYYYQRSEDEVGVGLFQLDKRFWEKNSKEETTSSKPEEN